jgi:membrane protein YqaA with SNARE-associated domain
MLYLAVGLSYLAIGAVLAFVYVYLFRRTFAGKFWGAAIVAIAGAFLGGLLNYLFRDLIEHLSSINGVLNIFPPIIAAAVLLSIFAGLSERKDDYE